jgi:hypothetical protein
MKLFTAGGAHLHQLAVQILCCNLGECDGQDVRWFDAHF